MNDKAVGLDQTEEDALTYKVSDKALETAAGHRKSEGESPHKAILFWFIHLPGLTRLLNR